MNYLHWGAPKQWYGVPAAAAAAFEAAFQAALPRQFEQAPDLLFHLVTMLAPRTLQQHDVPVYGITQVWELVQDPSMVSTERRQGAAGSKQGPNSTKIKTGDSSILHAYLGTPCFGQVPQGNTRRAGASSMAQAPFYNYVIRA